MKNLKKLSREELKSVNGGKVAPGTWCCCLGLLCSQGVSGDSDNLYCRDFGTSLTAC